MTDRQTADRSLRGEKLERPADLADAPGRSVSAGISGDADQGRGFLDLCFNPDLAVEVTLQPIARLGSMRRSCSPTSWWCRMLWQTVRFEEGRGRCWTVDRRRRSSRLGMARFHAGLQPVYETWRQLKNCRRQTALIGFAGAPWTVASYMIEGGRAAICEVKAWAYGAPRPSRR